MIKVLFAASESVPFVKTGGLADVVGALPPVLRAEGVDVRVILPKYTAIAEELKQQMRQVASFEVDLGWRKQYCGIETVSYAGVTWYFVDNEYYFGRPYIYGLGGDEYERYGFFCRAVLNALPWIDFVPDVLHCHDWQTGMIPALLRIQYAHIPLYANIRTIQTVHNLQYQGIFGVKDVQDCLGLGDSLFTADKLEAYGMANYLKSGLVYADEITTVSPSYAEEITTEYYGERLDGLLRARNNVLHGILNGIDVQEYNPEIDPVIAENYQITTLSGKAACKAALQRGLGMQEDPSIPVVGMVTRLSNQKGLDLIDNVIAEMMKQDIQLVVLGMGDEKYVNMLKWAASAYPGRVAARFEMNHDLAHHIYAGADIFLMPSQFEPCGLSQMISMRYGTVPVARETGGLRDTVLSYNEYTGDGNGFTFFNYNAHDMLFTLKRALDYYRNEKQTWQLLMQRGMEGDYSWAHSAKEYVRLYEDLLTFAPAEQTKAEAAPPKKAKAKKTPVQKELKAAKEKSLGAKAPPKEKKAPAKAKSSAKAASQEKPRRAKKASEAADDPQNES